MSSELRVSPYQFPEVYEQLGIDLKRLGGVMLDVAPLQVVQHVPGGEDDLYYSQDPRFSYAAGAVGEDEPHVTLNFGFLRPATEYRPHIDRVLTGWSPEQVTVAEVSHFNSPVETESWYCIVGKLAVTPKLLEANARLKLLPHINTHPTYQPHVTFAYIKKDETLLDKWLTHLSDRFTGKQLAVNDVLNYGS